MAAYVILGMGFGILMNDRGYGPLWSIACSVFIFAGSMQYITADLLASAVSPLHAAIMTLMVNARHLFYGISMIGKYRNMGKFKPYLIFGLTDEIYSLLCDNKDYPSQKKRYSALLFSCNFIRSFILGDWHCTWRDNRYSAGFQLKRY